MCKIETGNRFRKLFEMYLGKWTQKEIAEKINVAYTDFNSIINGTYRFNGEDNLLPKCDEWLDTTESVCLKEELDKVNVIAAQSGDSQGQLAKKIGISATALSQMLAGKYQGNKINMIEKLREYMKAENERKIYQISNENFVETSITRKILGAIKNAHYGVEMTTIIGPSGCGKTHTIKYYVSNNSNVIMLRADAVMQTNDILDEICASLRIKTPARRGKKLQIIINKLKGTGRLIIIDESQALKMRTIETIRTIHDEAEIGIVFIGQNTELSKTFGKNEMIYDQLIGRTFFCELPNKISVKDIDGIINNYWKGCDKESREELRRIGNDRGKLRMVVKILDRAKRFARAKNEELTSEHVMVCARSVGN